MYLGELISWLAVQEDQDLVVPVGLGAPHSSRGSYEDLEFEAVADVTIGEMLKMARGCVGRTFRGYKGGDYTMTEYSSIYIGFYGEWTWPNEAPGPLLLSYMIGKPAVPSRA